MIHWRNDRNETSWLNEGFSGLAVLLNGYPSGSYDRLFARDPDLQLNDWPDDRGLTGLHYGASILFLVYWLELAPDNTLEAPLDLGGEVEEAVSVIAGATRFTRQKSGYRFEIRS